MASGYDRVKLLALPLVIVTGLLAAFPVLFATGDTPTSACAPTTEIAAVLATIRTLESGGDYTARAAGSSASGAYQFLDSTWADYGGYPQAWLAPPAVQDANATEHVQAILDAHEGDVTPVPVVWYLGHLPADGSPEWDQVPAPDAGNALTPREYQTRWLTEYDHQRSLTNAARQGTQQGTCRLGSPIAALADGYAYPGPADLFATADVDAPHGGIPAWDWPVPLGTPVYAVRGGTIVAVTTFASNWWDAGCQTNANGCDECGLGVTITDDANNQWTYCHGSALHVHAGDTVTAGTQLLDSGNTGNSTGPHLHLQIRTPDGMLRCPQSLLRALRDQGHGLDPTGLPTAGCVT